MSPADRQRLYAKLAAVRRRLFLAGLIRAGCRDAGIFLVLYSGLLLAEKVLALGLDPYLLLAACAGASLLVTGLRTVLWGRAGVAAAAEAVDRKLRLKERVSTAVYLDRITAPAAAWRDDWSALIHEDGARHLEGVSVREHFPVRPPRSACWLAGPAALPLLVLLLVPQVDLLGYGKEREEIARLEEEVEKKERELDREISEIQKTAREEGQEDLDELLQRVRSVPPPEQEKAESKSPPEAGDPLKQQLVRLSRREEIIRRGLAAEKFQDVQKTLEDYQKSALKDFPLTRKLRDALKEGDVKKALRELDDLKRSLRNLSRTPLDKLSPDERRRLEELGEELASLARDSQLLEGLSRSLSSLSSTLSAKDLQGAQKAAGLSAEEFAKLAKMMREMDSLKQALGLVQLSKQDLASLQGLAQGEPHRCPDCGKPKGPPNPWEKPGGT